MKAAINLARSEYVVSNRLLDYSKAHYAKSQILRRKVLSTFKVLKITFKYDREMQN